MNKVRAILTVFLLAVLSSALLGWVWVGHLPSVKMQAARVVLTLAALAALSAITLIWSAKPQTSAA
ncbi:MAG TPA: hypothetical protein VIM69_13570 [Opitutaceae bacterium]